MNAGKRWNTRPVHARGFIGQTPRTRWTRALNEKSSPRLNGLLARHTFSIDVGLEERACPKRHHPASGDRHRFASVRIATLSGSFAPHHERAKATDADISATLKRRFDENEHRLQRLKAFSLACEADLLLNLFGNFRFLHADHGYELLRIDTLIKIDRLKDESVMRMMNLGKPQSPPDRCALLLFCIDPRFRARQYQGICQGFSVL